LIDSGSAGSITVADGAIAEYDSIQDEAFVVGLGSMHGRRDMGSIEWDVKTEDIDLFDGQSHDYFLAVG
jgi:hypothetical protein